jgi:hypothetical protein
MIPVAVKKSHTAHWIDNPMLRHEACTLLLLSSHDGFPRVYAWGRSQWFEYLYMDRLGPCLMQALVEVGRYHPFNLRSGLLLMSQMVRGYVSVFKQDSDNSSSWTSSSTCTLSISSTAMSNQAIFFSVTLAETGLRNYT